MAKEGESEEETLSLAERNDRVSGLSTSGGPTCWQSWRARITRLQKEVGGIPSGMRKVGQARRQERPNRHFKKNKTWQDLS